MLRREEKGERGRGKRSWEGRRGKVKEDGESEVGR